MSLGEPFQTHTKRFTEFVLRETVQLNRLRDFVRLAADDDRY